MSEGSTIAEKPTEKEESQNWQTRVPAGNTAPHCKHVFVTVSFALRTHSPVRREPTQNSTAPGMSSRKSRTPVTKEALGKEVRNYGQGLGVDLLGQHVAAERDTPLQGDSRKVRTVSTL